MHDNDLQLCAWNFNWRPHYLHLSIDFTIKQCIQDNAQTIKLHWFHKAIHQSKMEKSFSPTKTCLTKFKPFAFTIIKSFNYKLKLVQVSRILKLHMLPRVFIANLTRGVKLDAGALVRSPIILFTIDSITNIAMLAHTHFFWAQLCIQRQVNYIILMHLK